MYESVLVPIDMGEKGFADKVVENALGILKPHGKLILLTVVPGYQMPLVGSYFPQGAFDHLVKDTKDQLRDFINNSLPIDPSECEMVVQEGKPADIILSVAKQQKADIIVMASHKQNRMERTVIGSIANKVVGRADMPVLVVKG